MELKVELEPREIIQGAFVGLMRQVESHCKGRQNAFGAGGDKDWQYHIEGALGEMAFAKSMNLYWTGAHAFMRKLSAME